MYRKTGTTASLPTDEKNALSDNFQFSPNTCTRIKSTKCQGAETDIFKFGQRKAKQSTIYRAKPCNEQIDQHSMVTLHKPAGDNYFH